MNFPVQRIMGETNINSNTNCYDYLKVSVTGINGSSENAYNKEIPYAINLYVSRTSTLMEGQVGLQCANVSSTFNYLSYFFMRCTYTDSDCELDSFTYGNADATDYIQVSYQTQATQPSKTCNFGGRTNYSRTKNGFYKCWGLSTSSTIYNACADLPTCN